MMLVHVASRRGIHEHYIEVKYNSVPTSCCERRQFAEDPANGK